MKKIILSEAEIDKVVFAIRRALGPAMDSFEKENPAAADLLRAIEEAGAQVKMISNPFALEMAAGMYAKGISEAMSGILSATLWGAVLQRCGIDIEEETVKAFTDPK